MIDGRFQDRFDELASEAESRFAKTARHAQVLGALPTSELSEGELVLSLVREIKDAGRQDEIEALQSRLNDPRSAA